MSHFTEITAEQHHKDLIDVICQHCGVVKPVTQTEDTTEFGRLCFQCINREYSHCDDCNITIHNDDVIITIAGTYICDDCFASNYVFCENCGYAVYEHDTKEAVNGDMICDDCADDCPRCGDCERPVLNREDTFSDGMTTVCETCFEDDWFFCESCNELRHVDDMFTDSGDPLCPQCWEAIESSEYIGSYHSKHRVTIPLDSEKTYKTGKRPLLRYGVELEFDDGDPCEAGERLFDISQCHGDVNGEAFIMEQDGSLSDKGIELITRPAAIKHHVENFPWTQITRTARQCGYEATSNAGMHINIGKDSLTDLEEYKLAFFIFRCENLCAKFGRRNYGNFCAPKDDVESRKLNAKITGKHRAVALIPEQKRIEFRFPRSTLNAKKIRGILEFIDCVCHFIKEHNVVFFANEDIGTLESKFMVYAKKQKGYNYLHGHMDSYVYKAECDVNENENENQ